MEPTTVPAISNESSAGVHIYVTSDSHLNILKTCLIVTEYTTII